MSFAELILLISCIIIVGCFILILVTVYRNKKLAKPEYVHKEKLDPNNHRQINPLIPIRIIGAYIAGVVVYILGFFIGLFAGNIQALIAIILPSTIIREEIWAGAAAMAANIGGSAMFFWIYPKTKSRRASGFIWCSFLVLFAIGYAISCIVFKDYHLLVYPMACIPLIAVMFYTMRKEEL